jgi:hypothetical protein
VHTHLLSNVRPGVLARLKNMHTHAPTDRNYPRGSLVSTQPLQDLKVALLLQYPPRVPAAYETRLAFDVMSLNATAALHFMADIETNNFF